MGPGETGEDKGRHRQRRRVLGLLGGAVGIAAILALPPWVRLAWTVYVSPSDESRLVVGLLRGLMAAYGLAVLATAGGSGLGLVRLRRARKDHSSRRSAAKAFALAGATLMGLVLLEAGSAAWLGWKHRLPDLPTQFSQEKTPGEVRLLVIGESSARGEPYDDWLSIGHIVAWQLEQVMPEKRFRVEMRAKGGNTLEVAMSDLASLDYRPDAVLLYAGHNEFMGRFSWVRRRPYYDNEKPPWSPRVLMVWAQRISPFCGLVGEAVEAWRVPEPPPKDVRHDLVDAPAFSAEEARALRSDFGRRLEALAAYTGRIGALPIFFIPAGNDGGYDPNRSFLAPSTPPSVREAVARSFQEALQAEATAPARSQSLYNALLKQHPEFAEAHFRLARLEAESGDRAGAARHFRKARDLDGLPQRCRSDFQAAYRSASRGHDVLLVDASAVLGKLGPLDDRLFQDAHHPTFLGYVALAQNVLDQLHAHRAFGWPESVPAPRIDPAECASHFGIGAEQWAKVCARSGAWYRINANLRYDPSLRLSKAARYEKAIPLLRSGEPPESVGVPGLGVLLGPEEEQGGRD